MNLAVSEYNLRQHIQQAKSLKQTEDLEKAQEMNAISAQFKAFESQQQRYKDFLERSVEK